jgi:hypothetical protein
MLCRPRHRGVEVVCPLCHCARSRGPGGHNAKPQLMAANRGITSCRVRAANRRQGFEAFQLHRHSRPLVTLGCIVCTCGLRFPGHHAAIWATLHGAVEAVSPLRNFASAGEVLAASTTRFGDGVAQDLAQASSRRLISKARWLTPPVR